MAEAWFCSYFKPASFVLAVDFSCSNICQGKASVYSSLLIYQRAMADVDTLAWEFFEGQPPQTSSGHNDDEAHTRKQTKENHTRFTHIPNHAFIMPIAPKCHGVLNQQRLDCLFNSLFRVTTKKPWKLHITDPMWGESTNDWWIPLTKGK